MKTCTKCKQVVTFELFSKSSKTKDGLQHHCKPCKLEYQRNNPNRQAVAKKFYDANRATCSARSVASRIKKREYYNGKKREWVASNHEHMLNKRRKWYEANKASDIERVRRRAGKIRQSLEQLTAAQRAEIQGLYDFCNIFAGFEVDHIVPLNGKTVNGLHVPWNLQVLTISENRKKGNKFDLQAIA